MEGKGLSIEKLAWWLLCSVEMDLVSRDMFGKSRKQAIRENLPTPVPQICLRHMITSSVTDDVPADIWKEYLRNAA